LKTDAVDAAWSFAVWQNLLRHFIGTADEQRARRAGGQPVLTGRATQLTRLSGLSRSGVPSPGDGGNAETVGLKAVVRQAGRFVQPSEPYTPADQVSRMHPVATDDSFSALPRAGADLLIDKTTRKRYPAAPTGSLLLTSAPFGWRGIVVEQHRLPPAEMPEHSVVGHGISVNVGAQPTSFAWTRRRDGWDDRPTYPGHCRVLTHGESHATRWLQSYNEISLVISPQFAADVVRDRLAANRIEFVSRHSVADPVIVDLAATFRAELSADAPNGVMYAETLTVSLVLHLLANYGVAQPKVPSPRGKLNAFQLRSVIDFIDAHLGEDVSLIALARQAHVSPFHFARLFRRTVGIPPHQFVLRLRTQRAIGLMKSKTLSLAHIAAECGFHDQPHFTRVFRAVTGTTPAAYPSRG
jgi:AraC family transcriptional regulator